jgi:hypothetical protein
MMWFVGGTVLRAMSVEELNFFPPMGSNLHPLHIRGSSGPVSAW